ncbi:PREDICTED: SLIT-ROBO Rho GTPase-activating protein 3, partial [Condylura cristata]|uniref:SLIT-ROBO Rho GTPase-activating protein 3 n=1 Tax=Condylura cristata TaxID=143302 RepID=UPI000643BAF2
MTSLRAAPRLLADGERRREDVRAQSGHPGRPGQLGAETPPWSFHIHGRIGRHRRRAGARSRDVGEECWQDCAAELRAGKEALPVPGAAPERAGTLACPASARQAKYSENKLKCTKARNDYLLNLAAANAAISKYYIHDVSDLIDCCDLGFHASLARTFRTYLSAEYNLETSRHEGLDVIESAVDNLDPRSDKHTVMDMCSQVFCPPLKFEFQPHMGDEVGSSGPGLPRCAPKGGRGQLAPVHLPAGQVRKTLDATMQTLQDMLTVEDFDVSDAFQHSRSTESVKSAASETYMSKINIAKRRANQQETEMFYFTKFKEYVNGSNLITKLQAKHDLLKQTLGEGDRAECGTTRPPSLPPKPQKMRRPRPVSVCSHKLFSGCMEAFIKDSGQAIPLVVESCIRFINLYGLQQQGIFRVPGSQVEVNDIKNSFERGEDPLVDDQNERDINSVAGVLKLYFRGLENPLFPKERFQDLISTIKLESPAERVHQIQQILVTLPRVVLVVMRYLFAFLNHLSQYSDENMMDPYNLAICFGPTLMHIPDGQDPVSCQAHVNEVIKTIIIHHEAIFPSPRELEGPVYEKCMAGGEEYCDSPHSEPGTIDEVDHDNSTEPHTSDEGEGAAGALMPAGGSPRPAAQGRRVCGLPGPSALPHRGLRRGGLVWAGRQAGGALGHRVRSPGGSIKARQGLGPRILIGAPSASSDVGVKAPWGLHRSPGAGPGWAGGRQEEVRCGSPVKGEGRETVRERWRAQDPRARGAEAAGATPGPLSRHDGTARGPQGHSPVSRAGTLRPGLPRDLGVHAEARALPGDLRVQLKAGALPGDLRVHTEAAGQLRSCAPLRRGGRLGLRRPSADQSPLCPQDIEKTMSTALHELRELERQNTAKQAPDVVLDTLEPLRNPAGPASSEPASPLHTIVIRDPDAAMRRSSSPSAEMM